MKSLARLLELVLLLAFSLSATAQSFRNTAARRSPAQIRASVAQKIGAERAARLKPVDEREAISVLTDSLGGFAVVGYNLEFPAVLAYGDGYIDMDNASPEFLYLLDLYEKALTTPAEEVEAARAKAPAKASVINTNITPLLGTTWAQRSPYNLRAPMSGSKHTLAGCVAVAFAQVFKFYDRPKKMHGYRRYHFNNDSNQREFCDYDFSTASFSWGNMPKKLKDDGFLGIGNTSATENNAVAELMFATGVLSSMDYGLDGSGSNTAAATACIDAACEDLSAIYTQYEDELVMAELKAGRPVVYAGSRDDNSGHCFVIDGCRNDGYLHCNLGWDGTDDGYYLPTDMQGWKFYQSIAIVRPVDAPTTYTPLPEIAGRVVRASRTAATSIEPGRWYTLWNSGRCSSPFSQGVKSTLSNVGTIPAGEKTEISAGQLVRFVPAEDGKYYIQTGLGDYWNTFVHSGNRPTTAAPQQSFAVGTIQSGYFYMKSGNSIVDCDGIGAEVVGWGVTIPTDIYSNASWQLFPVELGYNPNELPSFNEEQTYVIKNVGYSQGYLVATDDEDHPTLRGVTTDHSQGLYSGARYHDAPDFYSLNSFWHIKTQNGKYYLVNAGKRLFVSNAGDKTPYVFTNERKPINITVGSDGSYRLNSEAQAESYLCAATHLPNPAAFWTVDDDGSKWTIEPLEVYEHVAGLTAENASVSIPVGASCQLSVGVLPATAQNKQVTWTSLTPSVATVDVNGIVTGISPGTATVRANSVDNPLATTSFTITVREVKNVTSLAALNDGAIYTLRNTGSNGYSMGYLVATSAADSRPTLRGVVKVHSQGCIDDSYKASPDFASPCSFWQILTDGYQLYLYNVGTQKFLTNGGDNTDYFLTPEAVSINVTLGTDGNFRFNASTGAQSYLCAATHSDRPAAFWTADDEGSKWTITEVEDVPAEPTTFYAFKGGKDGTGATVKTIVDHIATRRYNVIDLILRGALRRKP